MFSIQSRQTSQLTSRSSCQAFLKIGVLENFSKLTRKHLCRSLLFIQVASPCNFTQKETLTQVFSCEFWEIFKSIFFYRTQSGDWSCTSYYSLLLNCRFYSKYLSSEITRVRYLLIQLFLSHITFILHCLWFTYIDVSNIW